MTQYIDKDALVAWIKSRLLPTINSHADDFERGEDNERLQTLNFINTLEVKEVNSWHKQSEEDIDDSINDWGLHSFICLMSDGTIQKFTGINDESLDGSINTHLDCVDDNYDWKYDDIIYWIEIPNIKAQKGESV